MNSVQLVGRLAKDIDVRANNDSTVAKFSVAVNREFKNSQGGYDADFISCVAFGKTAEFIAKYFSKGMKIGVIGRIQTGSFTNRDGQKVYTTDVVAEKAEFVESKNAVNNDSKPKSNADNGFKNIPPDVDEELPFN